MARKYSKSASKDVEREMHKYKHGKLKSGSGRKVKSRKQAIAIGLSEARKKGKKVPKRKKGRKKSTQEEFEPEEAKVMLSRAQAGVKCTYTTVMAGLVPAIHVFLSDSLKTWISA